MTTATTTNPVQVNPNSAERSLIAWLLLAACKFTDELFLRVGISPVSITGKSSVCMGLHSRLTQKFSRKGEAKMAAAQKANEEAIQAQMVIAARNAGLTVFHVPNGGRRNKVEAAKLKRIGVVAGVPDLIFVLPGGKTVWVEVKTDDGKLSECQEVFLGELSGKGHNTAVVNGIKDGLQIVKCIADMDFE